MEPFYVMKQRGHILDGSDPGFYRHTTHGGPNDDYNLASGPKRSGTARSDKALTTRDKRGPADLARSRRVGLVRTVCLGCGAVKDQGVCHHSASCALAANYACIEPRNGHLKQETTGPMASNETSADVGWH